MITGTVTSTITIRSDRELPELRRLLIRLRDQGVLAVRVVAVLIGGDQRIFLQAAADRIVDDVFFYSN